MRLHIHGKNFRVTDELREQVRLRLAFALSRFGHKIQDVAISLADLNGPKGGVDKQARFVVRLRPNGKVTIEETHSDLVGAIARAAHRAESALGRVLKRRRDAKIDRNGFSPRQGK